MHELILALGVIATGLSVLLGFKFQKISNPLAHNIAWMAWGAALAGAGTIVFSYTSLTDLYGELPDILVITLRLIIFGGITGADIYMLWRVRRIERGNG